MKQRERTLVLLICAMLVTLCFSQAVVTGDEVKKFNGTDDSVSLRFETGGGNLTAEMMIPNQTAPIGSWMNITGLPYSTTDDSHPLNVQVDVGDDGDFEWAFNGTGYGPMGHQDRLANGNLIENLTLNDGISEVVDLKLPKRANVTGSLLTFKGTAETARKNMSTDYVQLNDTNSHADAVPGVLQGTNINEINATVELGDIFGLKIEIDVEQDIMNGFSANDIYGNIYVGQSFRITNFNPATNKAILTQIDVYTSIVSAPDDNLYLEIYNATLSDSYPTGALIANVTIFPANVQDNGYTSFIFQNPPNLDYNKNYAFYLTSPGTIFSNGYYQLGHDDSGTSNANSQYTAANCWELLSTNGGSSWSKYVDSDLRFKTFAKAKASLIASDFTNITVNFNAPTSQSGDNLTYFFTLPTYSNNEWPFNIQNTNPFDVVFNLSAETYFNEFPYGIELDLGDDSQLDWIHFVEVKGNEKTSTLNHRFNPLLQSTLGVEDSFGTEFVTIPMRINSTGNGTLQIVEIDIDYEFTTTITGFGSEISTYIDAHRLEGSPLAVPVKVYSETKGKVQLDRLNYTYDGAPVYWPLVPLNLKLDEDTANFKILDLDKHFIDDYDMDLDYEVLVWTPQDSIVLSIHDGRWLAADPVNATNGTDWYGSVNNIRLRALDDNGFYVDTQPFTFEVMPVNDPPVITTTPPTLAEVGEGYLYDCNATDVEDDDLIYSLLERPSRMFIDPHGLISWTPEYDEIGFHNVTVDVFDGIDSVNQSWQIEVTSDNTAPMINSTPSTIAWVGEEYRYEIQAYDPDPYTTLVYSLNPLHPWGMYLEGTIITWIPGQTQVGNNSVKIHVFDGLANISQEWVITVGENNAPEFTSDPPTRGKVGVEYTYAVTATDEDHDQITFSLKEKPANLTMTANGQMTWMPREGDNNFTWLVEIIISDGKAQRSQRFNITIDPADAPPPPPPPNGNGSDDFDIMSILPYLLIIIIVVMIIAVIAATRKKKGKDEEDAEDGEWPEMDDGGSEAVVAAKRPAVDEEAAPATAIDDVFLVYRDGRLITHQARRLAPDMDSDIMSGMFTAIQSFIKDSFDKEGVGALKSFEYGDQKIVMSHGEYIFLAMVVSGGGETPTIRKRMKSSIREIEHKFGDRLKDWNGRLDNLKGINKALKPLVAMTMAEKQRALESELVNLLGNVEFHKGFIVVKTAVMNGASSVITDAELKLVFNKDALRIDHVHPDLPVDGSEVKVGNLGPDEKKTVAFYLDPLICVKSNIDATVTFKDSKGALRTKSMEQQKAEVVCPVLYSDEEINVAMLKRLVGDLKVHDSKVFPIPSAVKPKRVAELGKSMLNNFNTNLVREFSEKDPYYSEVWYYGKTKFSKKPVVVKLSVSSETNTIEFFVATEELAALTGLLAELGHEFAKAIRTEGISEKVTHITDPSERDRILQHTELLLHRHVASEEAEGELEPGDIEK